MGGGGEIYNHGLICDSSRDLEKKKSFVFTLLCKTQLIRPLEKVHPFVTLCTQKRKSSLRHPFFAHSVFQNFSAVWFVM